MKKIVLSALVFSALAGGTTVTGFAQQSDGEFSLRSSVSSEALTWKAITGLFTGSPIALAPGVNQETIDHVKELVEKNIESPEVKVAMLETIQQAQDLLNNNNLTKNTLVFEVYFLLGL